MRPVRAQPAWKLVLGRTEARDGTDERVVLGQAEPTRVLRGGGRVRRGCAHHGDARDGRYREPAQVGLWGRWAPDAGATRRLRGSSRPQLLDEISAEPSGLLEDFLARRVGEAEEQFRVLQRRQGGEPIVAVDDDDRRGDEEALELSLGTPPSSTEARRLAERLRAAPGLCPLDAPGVRRGDGGNHPQPPRNRPQQARRLAGSRMRRK